MVERQKTITDDLLKDPIMAPAPAKKPATEPHAPATALLWLCPECAEIETLSISAEPPMHRHDGRLYMLRRYEGGKKK